MHLFRHGGVSHWCDAHGNTCSIYDKLIEWWWFIISCAASDTGVRCGDGEKKAHLAQYTQKPHELRGRPMPSRRGLASLLKMYFSQFHTYIRHNWLNLIICSSIGEQRLPGSSCYDRSMHNTQFHVIGGYTGYKTEISALSASRCRSLF